MSRTLSKETTAYLEKLKKKLLQDLNRRKDEDGISLRSGQPEPDAAYAPGLNVESVGYDVEERKRHRTSEYELMDRDSPTPIFRRGEPFALHLQLSREYDPERDVIRFVASYGPRASVSEGTKFKIFAREDEENEEMNDYWRVNIVEINGPTLVLRICTPIKCQVGLWRYQIDFFTKDAQFDSESDAIENIFYILFNPFNPDDEVYLEGEDNRTEYLLRDSAAIFTGTDKQTSNREWLYGQFDYAVLPALALLMERSDLSHSERGSATLIARIISALINFNDENGLLVGNWSGNYRDGTSPVKWTGSIAIFEEYLRSGGKPVKFAQCWVFAGCVTTACRALGMPCRTVTCYNSGHDVDKTLTIDTYIDQNGRTLPFSRDSMWNYHCWNEVWMVRPDLSEDYDGWQVIDATPQEPSKGQYRLGPAPVKAVHEGYVGLHYDVAFVFSEVNADLCCFKMDNHSPWGYSLEKLDTKMIGKLIVTQSKHRGSRHKAYKEKITDEYKYPEGSEMERKIFYRALRQLPRAQKHYERIKRLEDIEDVIFSMDKVDSVPFGDHFDVALSIENKSDEPRSAEVCLGTSLAMYTGKVVGTIKDGDLRVTLQPKEKKVMKMAVSPSDYSNKLGETNLVKVVVVGKVKETGQLYNDDDVFEIMKTELIIEVPPVAMVGTYFEATFAFRNPLQENLTNCQLIVEASGVQRPKFVTLKDVPAEGLMTHSVQMVPKRNGTCVLVAVFHSDQLATIKGTASVDVQE